MQLNNLRTMAILLVVLCSISSAKIIYVDDDASGTNDGSSWENAYVYLQDALADANDSDKPVEIRVAQGIYRPDMGGGHVPGDRESTFQLINGVTLTGGYAGINANDPNARDIELYETVLSGDLNGDDVDVNDPADLWLEPSRAENSYRVVTASDTDATAVLDGFTITGGNAGRRVPDEGGGMYNTLSSPTLNHCTFSGNSADDSGGGMLNHSSSPTLTDCRFIGNWAGVYGGGMRNRFYSSPTLTNCTFRGNSSLQFGGGMSNRNCSPTLTDCEFVQNSAGIEGGGMSNKSQSSSTLTNCTFSGNSARQNGGGMYNDNSSPILSNCTFSGNSANDGGGMFNQDSDTTVTNCTFSGNSAIFSGGGVFCWQGSATVTNCILWGNTAVDPGNEIWLKNGRTLEITYSNVAGGQNGVRIQEGTLYWGVGNFDTDPCFVDPNEDDFHLKSQAGRWNQNSGSWIKDDVTSPCIDAGDPNSDYSAELWPHGERINIGAYGGTREASMSTETDGMSLPSVVYIYDNDVAAMDSFKSLLEMYDISVLTVSVNNLQQVLLTDYDLIIVGDDTFGTQAFDDGQFVAAVEDSGKPVLGLGYGGYDFFGELGLSIGSPNGGHDSYNGISVIEPEHLLFSTPYPIEVPDDKVLQLYTETDSVGIYFWPDVPETVFVIGVKPNGAGYYPLVMEHNRYLLWGFTESPQSMTEVGKRLFINVVIWAANAAWEGEN